MWISCVLFCDPGGLSGVSFGRLELLFLKVSKQRDAELACMLIQPEYN